MSWKKTIKNTLRIIFLFIFLFHILPFGSYAKCYYYQESIESAHSSQEQIVYGKNNETATIGKIEEDILREIEINRKVQSTPVDRPWKNYWESKLISLEKEIEELRKKDDLEEKKKLERKQANYNQELECAKQATITNIKKYLTENNLDITELNDNRSWIANLVHDPLKFCFLGPLHKTWKFLALSGIVGEIIFKLIIIKLIMLWINYKIKEGYSSAEITEKLNDISLSLEEREQIQQEFMMTFKYQIFNWLMAFFFNFSIFFHPTLFDRTNEVYRQEISFRWIIPLFLISLLAAVSGHFVQQKKTPNPLELKNYLKKSGWVILLISLFLCSLPWIFPNWFQQGRMWGGYLYSIFGSLLDFTINIIKLGWKQRKSRIITTKFKPYSVRKFH